MPADVNTQLVGAIEVLVAVGTHKGSFSCVGAAVAVQVLEVGGFVAAVVTLKDLTFDGGSY